MKISVARSPLRLLAYALFAVPAILLAVDMTISHRWISPPETTEVVIGQTTDEDGLETDITQAVLTDTGKAERRRDLFIGSVLFAGGVVAILWAINELARPTALLEADDEALSVRVDGPRRPLRRFGWDGIVEVRSGVIEDDGIEVPVLSVRLLDVEEVPFLPAGARAEPPWLHIYADEWDTPAHQVAPLLDQHAARPRPVEEYE